MALPDSRFVGLFPLQEVLIDKDTGELLASGQVTFYSNTQPTVLKPIYQQVQLPDKTYLFVPLVNPITLTGIGSFADNNGNDIIPFLFPFQGTPDDSTGEVELYYITVESSGGVLQFTREAWPPGLLSGSNPITTFDNSENALANPQFVEVFFSPVTDSVFTVTGTNTETVIAPDWSIITSGSGSFHISKVAITDVDSPSNPPFALDITSSGITDIALRQRLSQSPRLFSNGFASATMVAKTVGSATPVNLVMNYIPSTGTTVQLINASTPSSGNFATFRGTAEINNSNTDSGEVGYVDISVTIPVGSHIQISSLQLVSVQNISSSVEFLQETTARQLDHFFHYYKDSIVIQPKPTILTGWNFCLNPWQFYSQSASNLTGTSAYTSDQTILLAQTVNSLATQNYVGKGYGVNARTGVAQGRFAIIQYIDTTTISPWWNNKLSASLIAKLVTTHTTELSVKIRLIYRSTVPPDTTPITAWVSGDVTLAAGWTAVKPLNDQIYKITSTEQQFSFDQFILPAQPANTAMVGIMIITLDTLNSTATADSLIVHSCSLIANDFSIDSQPQTYDQVLKECQFYYEKSNGIGILPGTAGGGCLMSVQSSILDSGMPTISLAPSVFGFPFKNIKRTTPRYTAGDKDIKFYSPSTGTINLVFGEVWVSAVLNGTDIAIGNWDIEFISNQAATFKPASGTQFLPTAGIATNSYSSDIQYHYTVDARLGIVP